MIVWDPNMTRSVFAAVFLLLGISQSTAAQQQPPITTNEIRRLAVDDSRGALARGEEVLASDYAAAHPEWKRELLFEMSRAAAMLSDQQRVESIAERLDALSKLRGDSLAAAYARIVRARSLAESGRHPQALEQITAAAQQLEARGTPEYSALAAGELCDVATRMVRPDLGRIHCEQARVRWQALGDDFHLARAHNGLAAVATLDQKFDEAIRRLLRARIHFERAALPGYVTMIDDNLGHLYLAKGDARKALELSRRALKSEVASGKVTHAILSRANVAAALGELGRHDEALREIEEAIRAAQEAKYESALQYLYQTQLEIAQRMNRPDIVARAATNAIDALTKLSTESRERAVAEMEARYRSLARQREIERLEQENKLKALRLEAAESRLRRQQLGMILGVVVVISLAAVSALLLLLLRTVRRREREFQTLSNTDPLTGMSNRRAFLHALDLTMARAVEESFEAALLEIDADYFKQVNDTFGHQSGDAALRHLVARIREHIRTSDTLGRLGGEEFGLVLPGITESDALERAERIRGAVKENPVMLGERAVPLSVSIGLAMLDRQLFHSVDEWLGAADKALYEAKRSGRNCVRTAPATDGG